MESEVRELLVEELKDAYALKGKPCAACRKP